MKAEAARTRRSGRALCARRRASVYGLLARLYRREPDSALVGALRSPPVFESLVAAGMYLDRKELSDSPASSVAATLAADYTDLFIAPYCKFRLNESIQRPAEGALMGRSAVQVKQFIRSLGLATDDAWMDFPDHIAVELEVLHRLAATEARLWDAEDRDAVAFCRARQRDFLNDHLAAWVPELCDRIAASARTAFYRELARLTASFLRTQMTG